MLPWPYLRAEVLSRTSGYKPLAHFARQFATFLTVLFHSRPCAKTRLSRRGCDVRNRVASAGENLLKQQILLASLYAELDTESLHELATPKQLNPRRSTKLLVCFNLPVGSSRALRTSSYALARSGFYGSAIRSDGCGRVGGDRSKDHISLCMKLGQLSNLKQSSKIMSLGDSRWSGTRAPFIKDARILSASFSRSSYSYI